MGAKENISIGKLRVSGDIKAASPGGSVEARWGQIEGDIESQADLMAALNEKASASDLTELETEVAAKASASALNDLAVTVEAKADEQDLLELAGDVAEKLTTPSGTEGQFLVYHNGEWQGQTLAAWEGGNY